MEALACLGRLWLSSRATHSYNHTGGGRRDASQPAPLAGLTLLDVGCGGGLLSEALARLGAAVTGVDAGADSIAVARAHAAADPELQVSYRAATAEQLVDEGAQAPAHISKRAGQDLGTEGWSEVLVPWRDRLARMSEKVG